MLMHAQEAPRPKYLFGQMAGIKSPLGDWGVMVERTITMKSYYPSITAGAGVREGGAFCLGLNLPITDTSKKLHLSGSYYFSYFTGGDSEYGEDNEREVYTIGSSLASTPILFLKYKPFLANVYFSLGYGYRINHLDPSVEHETSTSTKLSKVNRNVGPGNSIVFSFVFGF